MACDGCAALGATGGQVLSAGRGDTSPERVRTSRVAPAFSTRSSDGPTVTQAVTVRVTVRETVRDTLGVGVCKTPTLTATRGGWCLV